MPDTMTPPAGGAVPANTTKAFHRMRGRARFGKTDASFDHRNAMVTIGLWLPDRHTTRYPAGLWPIRHATLHWRRYDVTVARALNYEFHIDQPKPYTVLTDVTFGANEVCFIFGEAMRIRVGVSQPDVSYRQTVAVREDWGIPAWAVTILPTNTPLVMARGAQHDA